MMNKKQYKVVQIKNIFFTFAGIKAIRHDW